MPGRRSCAALLLALVLTACVPGREVRVSGSRDAPMFEILVTALHRRGPIDSIVVEDVSSDTGVRLVMWAADDPACTGRTRRVNYGVVPEGFAERIKAKALRANNLYLVTIGVCGYTTHILFRIEGDRVVAITAPSDLSAEEIEKLRAASSPMTMRWTTVRGQGAGHSDKARYAA